MESDLVGIPVALAAVAVVGFAIVAFYLAGPVAGLVFVALGLGLFYLLITRPGSQPRDDEPADPRPRAEGGVATGDARRLLVIANRGLGEPGIAERLRALAGDGAEIRIVAPAPAASALRALADDVDAEHEAAEQRLEGVLAALRETGTEAGGHADTEADPRSALADGLREYSADHVALIRGDEPGWDEADEYAARLEAEGVSVTRL